MSQNNKQNFSIELKISPVKPLMADIGGTELVPINQELINHDANIMFEKPNVGENQEGNKKVSQLN